VAWGLCTGGVADSEVPDSGAPVPAGD